MFKGFVMKLNRFILAIVFMTGVIFASELNIEESISEKVSLQDENKHLKEKIKKLEVQLQRFTQVKPVVSSAVLPLQSATEKKTVRGAKFVLSTTAPKILTAYYVADYQTVDKVKKKLETNGFLLLSVNEILPHKTVLTFTNAELQKTNSFLSALHLLVNDNSEIRVQNPSYFGAAFLQDKYKYGQFKETLLNLKTVLGEMYESEDKFEFDELADYNFMFGMPDKNDMITVAKGNSLLSRLREENATQYIAYSLQLSNGTTLVGHKLQHKTYAYLKTIKEEHNVQLFPYEVIIRENKAVMLHPKYYLALSLPLLSMTDFMKIASAPAEIVKDIEKAYK